MDRCGLAIASLSVEGTALLDLLDIADQCYLYKSPDTGKLDFSDHNFPPERQKYTHGMKTFLPDSGDSIQSLGEPFQSMECSIQATPQHHSYSTEGARAHASSILDCRIDSEVLTTCNPAPASAFSVLSSQSGQCLGYHLHSMEAAQAHGSSGQRLGSQWHSHAAARAAEPTSSQYDPAPYPASPTCHYPQSLPWSDFRPAAYTANDISPTQTIQSSLSSLSVPSLIQNTPSQYDHASYRPQSLQWSDPQSAVYTTNDASPSPPTMSPSFLTRSRGFQCDTCNKKFASKQNFLEIHIEAIHKKSKRFACSTCGETFSYQQSRNRHQKSRCPVARARS
ncbi:hypothetical protein BT96DRAFT_987237 [Gymnopus androsaceus JB14]|uniref:C2H2-type domain-containing protein n=1 Tax=Gymnopus androsaceus JB14 TaxID=1447944 RepID=A0A6A4IBL6_9AGAR|nr:hypothetical protein BT96DRAFT_987237 [Gymnopus androsaceus JB14]